MTFDFQKQLKIGKKGESQFLEKYGKTVAHHCEEGDIKAVDFRFIESNELIELKTDSYDMEKTPNFFIERFSDVNRESPGGPWQALEKGATFFCYNFSKNGEYFWFYTDELVKRLNSLLEGKKQGMVYIRNRGWTTGGYKMNRELFKDLELDL